MLRRLVSKIRALLNLPLRLDAELRRLHRDVDKSTRDLRRALKAQQQEAAALARDAVARTSRLQHELASARQEISAQLAQQHLRLVRLTHVVEGGSPEPQTYSKEIPLAIEPPASRQVRETPPSSEEWLTLDRCPACQTVERTLVCEWNKFILRDDRPDDAAAVYRYSLCHGCGIVYAVLRPIGDRFRALADDFTQAVGRQRTAARGLLHPYPLTDEDRAHYRRLIDAGVFVSDHEGREYLDGVFKDRLENAAHVEILGALADLRGARVLEVRSRAGTIGDALRRYYGATVAAMPIFESQQFILRELYGIECSDLIDFEAFTIPFDREFDLIVCNHIFTHSLRPERLFAEVRAHLRPGGHLYFYNESDEAEFLGTGKSILSAFNPLHLQAFDQASLIRALNANGFDVQFIKGRNGTLLCLARYTQRAGWSRVSEAERTRRVEAYAKARAHLVLKASDETRERFADVWTETVEAAVASGVARFDTKGKLHLVKE